MYLDYLSAIKKFYLQRRQTNQLSQRLLYATPAKLRDECIDVLTTRPRKEDAKILMTFFEVTKEVDKTTIERFELEKFKPLVNYLRNGTDNSADKNIELLGWLVDFPGRPYSSSRNYLEDIESDDVLLAMPVQPGKGEQSVITTTYPPVTAESARTTEPVVDEVSQPAQPVRPRQASIVKRWALIAAFMGAGATGSFFYVNSTKDNEMRVSNFRRDNLSADSIKSTYVIPPDSLRCTALTLKGTRCKHKSRTNKLCWQHGG